MYMYTHIMFIENLIFFRIVKQFLKQHRDMNLRKEQKFK